MNHTIKLKYSLFFILFFAPCLAISQNLIGGKTEQQIELEAFTFFDGENYQAALPLYQELINIYPQDPEYNYYLGVCQVETNQRVPEAIKHLKIASAKNIKASAPYYLGRAFHMNYQFNSAIRYYRIFREYYKKKSIGIDRLIEMCQNALPLVNSYYVIDLKKKKAVDKNEFFRHYDLTGFNERLYQKNKSIKSRLDGKGDKDIACLANNGEDVYFSSYGRNKKRGRDLYRAKRLENGGWGEWEPLTDLNTPFDEVYPFMASDGRTLYFCSQGHTSMGGFDIFRSVYNEITNTWTEPENLGFPYNSISNDLFYATDANDEYACFTSSRENGKLDFTVYKIKKPEYLEQRPVMNPEMLPVLATLQVSSQGQSEESYPNKNEDGIQYLVKYTKNNFLYFSFPVTEELTYHSHSDFKSTEAQTLFIEARNDQFNSDSLIKVAEKSRAEFNQLKGNKRNLLRNKLVVLENRSYELANQANRKLIQAKNLEAGCLKKNIIGVIETEVVVPVKQKKVLMTSGDLPRSGSNPAKARENTRGYVYHLQVGVFSNRPNISIFAGLHPLKEELAGSGKLYKYMVGNYSTFLSAKEAIPKVKQIFPNAFVVAYKDGIKANLNEAIKATDQDYQAQPVLKFVKQPAQSTGQTVGNHNQSQVVFKVQAGAYSGEVPQSVKVRLEKFSKYEIAYIKDSRGYTVCTIGNFDSYSKVNKLKMELREAGLSDAFTVAYSGNTKITVKKALEILDNKSNSYVSDQ